MPLIGSSCRVSSKQSMICCSRRDESGGVVTHKLLLGTHTSDEEQNYLKVAKMRLPTDSTPVDQHKYNDEDGGMLPAYKAYRQVRYGLADKHISGPVNGGYKCRTQPHIEFGGFGAPLGKLEIVHEMKHNGEVNRYASKAANSCILSAGPSTGPSPALSCVSL